MNVTEPMVERMAPRHWSNAEIASRVSLEEMVSAVRAALELGRRGGLDQPPRLSLGNGRLLVMAARAEESQDYVVKTVSVSAHGEKNSGVRGTVLVTEGRTGESITADAAMLTELRTAALVTLATKSLAPEGAQTLAILGAGKQAKLQTEAAALVRPITSVRVWNRTRWKAEALVEELREVTPGVQFEVAQTADIAVRGADIVTCATAAIEPLFDAASLEAHAHVNAIGSYRPDMHEVPEAALAAAGLVAVDGVEACLAESGEIIDAVASGVLDPADLLALPDLLAEPRTHAGITVFKTVGVAAADFAAGRLLLEVK